MKILVTGGLGYAGSWVTERLVMAGHEVATFSRKDHDLLREYDFERVFGNVEKREDVLHVIASGPWEVVIHLASVGMGPASSDYAGALSVNTLGTRHLLSALSAAPHKNTHLIYFSTFHVYGSTSGEFEENKTLPFPKNDYANTHLFAEHYIRQQGAVDGLHYTILRLTNSYGAPKAIDCAGWDLVLNDLVRTAENNRIIQLKGSGQAKRDLVWLGNVCDVVERCIAKGPANDTFNLGSGSSRTVLELAEIVKETFEDLYSERIEIRTNPTDQAQRQSASLSVSIEKLQNWIEFQPQDRLHDEVKAAFAMLKDRWAAPRHK
jgi:UDP-glucose 4-epimerase